MVQNVHHFFDCVEFFFGNDITVDVNPAGLMLISQIVLNILREMRFFLAKLVFKNF